MSKPYTVCVVGKLFGVLNTSGDEVLTSQEYSDEGGAKRAARNFCEAMQKEVVLEFEDAKGDTQRESFGGSAASRKGAKPSATKAAKSPHAAGQRLPSPEPGVSLHARSPLASSPYAS